MAVAAFIVYYVVEVEIVEYLFFFFFFSSNWHSQEQPAKDAGLQQETLIWVSSASSRGCLEAKKEKGHLIGNVFSVARQVTLGDHVRATNERETRRPSPLLRQLLFSSFFHFLFHSHQLPLSRSKQHCL